MGVLLDKYQAYKLKYSPIIEDLTANIIFKLNPIRFGPEKHMRILFFHSRKTGGTSLNHMFTSYFSDADYIASNFNNHSKRYRVIHKGFIVQASNISLLEKGNYHYGCTHIPSWKINEPSDTFTITVFRDPIRRVISHYNDIKGKVERGEKHSFLREESKFLGSSFTEFVDNLPPEKLLSQLYNFSKNFDIDEAVKKINSLNLILTLEAISNGIQEINNRLDIDLQIVKRNKSKSFNMPSTDEINYLSSKITQEIDLFKKLKISF